MVLDRAKDLLTTLHIKVMEAEKQERESAIVPYDELGNVKRRSLNPSIFSSDMIPPT
jgi:hypothetical protein